MKRKSSEPNTYAKRARSNDHDVHRQKVRQLEFLVSALQAKHQAIRKRNERLRDENGRLRQQEDSFRESAAQQVRQCLQANSRMTVNVLEMLSAISNMMKEDSVQLSPRVEKGFQDMVTLLRGG